jgi:hypothetical protein
MKITSVLLNSKLSKYKLRILEYIDDHGIYQLTLGSIFFGIAFIAIGLFGYKYLSHGNTLVVWNRIIGSIGFFVMGFAGIFQIITKDLLVPIKKSKFTAVMAVLNGIVIVSLCWFLAIYFPLMSILGY